MVASVVLALHARMQLHMLQCHDLLAELLRAHSAFKAVQPI